MALCDIEFRPESSRTDGVSRSKPLTDNHKVQLEPWVPIVIEPDSWGMARFSVRRYAQ
jgi:hypothetical protein